MDRRWSKVQADRSARLDRQHMSASRGHAGFEVRDTDLRSTAEVARQRRLITQSGGADDTGQNPDPAQNGRQEVTTRKAPTVQRIRRNRHRPGRQPRRDLLAGLRAVLPPPPASGPAAGLRRPQHRHLRRDLAADHGARGHRAGLRPVRHPVDHPVAVDLGDPARGRLLLRRPGDGPGERDGHPRPPTGRDDQRVAAERDGDRRQQGAAGAHPPHGRPPRRRAHRRRLPGRRPGAAPGRHRAAPRGERRRLRAPDHAGRRALPRRHPPGGGAPGRAADRGHPRCGARRRRGAGRRPGAPVGWTGAAPPGQGHRLRARHHGGRGDLPRLDAGRAPEPRRAPRLRRTPRL